MATTPTGIELKLADGSVIKAENVEEALKIAAKMKEDTSAALREEKAARESLQSRLDAIEAQAREAARPRPVDGQFNKDEYYRKLNDDPIAAQNYLDSFRFGIPDPNAVPLTFQQMQRDVSVTRQESMAAQFMQQHAEDFPQTPEAARALRTQFESYIASGYPATVETLNLAYNQTINEGTIKPLEKEPEETRQEPNPVLAGGGASAVDASEMQKVEQMSDAELEKYMKEKGLL